MPMRDDALASKLVGLGKNYKRLGSKKLSVVLSRDNIHVNHKAIDRVRRKLGLVTKKKVKRRLVVEPMSLPAVSLPNELWSIDFVHNRLANHGPFRCFTCVDVVDRRSPGILVKGSIKSKDVTKFLEGLAELPKGIILDNGTEFRSKFFEQWCLLKGIKLHFIEKASPSQNGFVESFNGKFRYECLSLNNFRNLREAKRRIENWRRYYNRERPHGALGMLSPEEYSRKIVQWPNALGDLQGRQGNCEK